MNPRDIDANAEEELMGKKEKCHPTHTAAIHRTLIKHAPHEYSVVLDVMKKKLNVYLVLHGSDYKVHTLYCEQLKPFNRFLAMLVKPEAFTNLVPRHSRSMG